MQESTKINFVHSKILRLSDFAELVEMLFPGNRNQQHAAACIFFELKWANNMVPKLANLETKYCISHRILQRTRAKLSRLGLIEHISYLNSRYGYQNGWKLSTRFERSLNRLAQKCAGLRDITSGSKDKDAMLIDFADAKRNVPQSSNKISH